VPAAYSIEKSVEVVGPGIEHFEGVRQGYMDGLVGEGIQAGRAGAAFFEPLLSGNEEDGYQEMVDIQAVKRIPGTVLLFPVRIRRMPASLMNQSGQPEFSRPGSLYSRVAPVRAARTGRQFSPCPGNTLPAFGTRLKK
jgi:hypothetical protein